MAKRPTPIKPWQYVVFWVLIGVITLVSALALLLISSDGASYFQCGASGGDLQHSPFAAVYIAIAFFVLMPFLPILEVLTLQPFYSEWGPSNSSWLWMGATCYGTIQIVALTIYADCGNILQLALSQVAAIVVVVGSVLCARFWRWW